MLESTGFTYAATPSSTYGIINCRVSSGLFEEPFISSTDIFETVVRNREVPFFQGQKRNPLTFKLVFAIDPSWTTDIIRGIAKWLWVDGYKPLIFDDFPNMVFYAQATGDSNLFHNGAQSGYIELTMRCSSPFGYMPILSQNISATPTINNDGDLPIKPEISILTTSAGNVTITNTTNGKSFTLTGLANAETVYLNCDTEQILTDLSGTYRYSAFTGDFLQLNLGTNSMTITGNATVTCRFERKILQS